MRRHRLIERREELDIKQADIARSVGVDRSTYTRYETGLRTPSLDTAKRIAKTLNTTVEHLFNDDVPIGNLQTTTLDSA